MPTERTEFQFEQRGGQNVLNTLRQIAKSADSAAAAWTRMNTASAGGISGGRASNSAAQVKLDVAAMRMKTQELKTQASAQRAYAESERQTGRALVAEQKRIQEEVKRSSQLSKQQASESKANAQLMVSENRRIAESEKAISRAIVAEESKIREQIRSTAAVEQQRLKVRQQIANAAGRRISGQLGLETAGVRLDTAKENRRSAEIRQEIALTNNLSRAYQKYGAIGALAYKQLQAGNAGAFVALNATRRAAQIAGNALRSAFRGATSAIRGMVGALTAIPRALLRTITSPLGFLAGGAGAFFAGRSIIRASDAYLNIQNRIAATNDKAAKSTKLLAQTQNDLFDIARRSRAPIESLAELYGRLAIGARDAAFSQKNLLTITETVSKASSIGGGTQQSIEGALIQLSQIFGAGGRARGIGQELRSLREQAPYLFIVMAQGLQKIGVTINGTTGEMERLAEKGELTSEQIGQALLAMSDEVEARFRRITPPIDQALTVLRNSWIRFVGSISQRTGAGRSLADTIMSIADRLDKSADKISERISTIATVFNRTFLSDGLTQAERKAASDQWNRIQSAALDAANSVLRLLASGLIEIMRAAAEVFGTAFVKVFGDSIADTFERGGFGGIAKAFRSERGELRKLNQDIADVQLRIQGLQSANVFTKNLAYEKRVTSYTGQPGSPVPVPAIESQSDQLKRLQSELSQMQKRSAQLTSQVDRDIDRQTQALIASLEKVGSGFNKLTINWGESTGKMTSQIDEVTQELNAAKYQIISINPLLPPIAVDFESIGSKATEAFYKAKDGIIDTRVELVKWNSEVQRSSEYVSKFQESLQSRRLKALGFDADSAVEDIPNRLKKRMKLIEMELKRDLPSLNAGLYESTLAELRKSELGVITVEAQRKSFDSTQESLIKRLTMAEKEYQRAIEVTNAKRDSGFLTAAESQRRILDFTRDYSDELNGVIPLMDELGQSEFLKDAPLLAEKHSAKIAELRHEYELLALEMKRNDPDNFWGGFRKGAQSAWEEVDTLNHVGQKTGQIFSNAVANGLFDAFNSIIQGSESAGEAFKKLAAGILSDLARMIFQMAVFNALQNAAGGGGLFGGIAGALIGSAKGNVFDNGYKVSTFAAGAAFSGGYTVDRPTIFPMARGGIGVMGEAGTEGVFPLDRDSSGNLGVKAMGNGGVSVLPVMVTDREQLARMVASGDFDEVIARRMQRPGALRQAVRGAAGK